MSERIIVLHDFFNTPDGGGKVATILARSFPSELFTGELNEDSFPDGYFRKTKPKNLEAYETFSLSSVFKDFSALVGLFPFSQVIHFVVHIQRVIFSPGP